MILLFSTHDSEGVLFPAVLCLVAQLCPTLYDPMDWSPPGSSVKEILQARIPEWVTMPSSRGSSQPREWTQVSCIACKFFTIWATKESHIHLHSYLKCQASLSFTISWSLLKLMFIESVMPFNHFIFFHPLLLPSIFPASGSFLDLFLCIRCPI